MFEQQETGAGALRAMESSARKNAGKPLDSVRAPGEPILFGTTA